MIDGNKVINFGGNPNKMQKMYHGISCNSTLDGGRTDRSILSKLAAGNNIDRQVNLNILLLRLVHHLLNDL